MIVTDLHGDWNFYQFYRDRFLDLLDQGQADCLIFAGDLIHANSVDDPDHSIDIVLDVMDLQKSFGQRVLYLCGNHELPHIYSFGLSKGKREYTPAFEAAMNKSGQRSNIIDLFSTLPFFIRTKAGISITHAGAFPHTSSFQEAKTLFEWDHDKYLSEAKLRLAQMDISGMRRGYAKLCQADSYASLASHYLGVTESDDPRFDDLLVGLLATSDPEYQRLHSALFTKCEFEFGMQEYLSMLEKTLQILSNDYWPQTLLVTGHITIPNGHQFVSNQQLRLASGCHATPKEAGEFLIFNGEQRIDHSDLATKLYKFQDFA